MLLHSHIRKSLLLKILLKFISRWVCAPNACCCLLILFRFGNSMQAAIQASSGKEWKSAKWENWKASMLHIHIHTSYGRFSSGCWLLSQNADTIFILYESWMLLCGFMILQVNVALRGKLTEEIRENTDKVKVFGHQFPIEFWFWFSHSHFCNTEIFNSPSLPHSLDFFYSSICIY